MKSIVLLREIILRYELPLIVGIGNGPAFVTVTTQKLTEELKLTWNLQIASRPQNSRKMERINRTVKSIFTKFHQEMQANG